MAEYEAHKDARLLYDLRGLTTAATVLHVGTHPDDEETGLLAYLARGRGVRTVYWSATRGEGGQNRLGPETQEALGVLRTWESLAACRVNGAEPLYGPFYDFGFSKTAEDTLARWGHDDVVREIVRAIRYVMPQVVIARWSGGPSDGHGQHRAIGIATREAFAAAGDPDRFPELREHGLVPWQPHKLYHSMAGDWQPGEDEAFGQRDDALEREGLLRIDTGVYDPVSGRSYQEQAALAWNQHRTQAMAFLPEWREFLLYYRRLESHVAGPAVETDFFDGVDVSLAGLVGHFDPHPAELAGLLADAQRHADDAADGFHPFRRQAVASALLDGLAALRRADGEVADRDDDAGWALRRWLARRTADVERVIARLLGIDLDCAVERARVTPGEAVRVTARLTNKHGPPISAGGINLHTPEGWPTTRVDDSPVTAHDLVPGVTERATFDVTVPATAPYTTPYWFRAPRTPYAYAWPDDVACGLPFDEPLVSATCTVQLGSHRFVVSAPGVLREGLPGGYREIPLEVLPAIAIEPREHWRLLPGDDTTSRVHLQVTARCLHPGGAKGTIAMEVPGGWEVHPPIADVSLEHRDTTTVRFEVDVPPGVRGRHQLTYHVRVGDTDDSVVMRPVHQLAPGLPGPATEATCVSEVFIAAPATVTAHALDAQFVRTLRYGYVQGAKEEIVQALSGFDLDLHLLTDDDLAFGDLAAYDTIVVGPNAYAVRAAVRKNAGRLLDYAARGGTLVVQYQGYGYADGDYAPHPFAYSQPHDRVTRPDAPVEILEPEHPALRSPNPITAADFDGWVHDRGLYFFGSWDKRYTPLLGCADPGESPKRGGLLVTSHGRGTYVYAAYSFFRQLPAGVEGATKLLANLMGLSEALILDRVERLRGVPLFAPMSDAELYEIARLVSEDWFDDGAFLSREGERGRELYLVLAGEIDVVKEGGDQWDVVYVAGPGDVIGELAPLAALPRSASLRARGDTTVLTMRGEDFNSLLAEHAELARDVLRILATRLARQGGTDGSPSG